MVLALSCRPTDSCVVLAGLASDVRTAARPRPRPQGVRRGHALCPERRDAAARVDQHRAVRRIGQHADRGPGEGARHENKALAAELAPLVRQFLEHEFVTTPGHVAVQAHEHRGKAIPSQLRGVMGKMARLRSALAISDDRLVALGYAELLYGRLHFGGPRGTPTSVGIGSGSTST